MKIFLQAQDFDILDFITSKYIEPQRPKSTWTEAEKRSFLLNSSAMNFLYCAMDKNVFNRVSCCETAFDIWHTLEDTYEGTSTAEESKINLLVHDCEAVKMLNRESISDVDTSQESSEEEEEESCEEMIILTKKTKRIIRRREKPKKEDNRRSCSECSRRNHSKSHCPILKKRRKMLLREVLKDDNYSSTISNSSSSKEETEEEKGKMCFLAHMEIQMGSIKPKGSNHPFDDKG